MKFIRLKTMAAVLSALCLGSIPLGAQIRGFHQTQLKEWEFSKDGSSWEEVIVPHSYNARDGHSASYYRGEATYRCDIRLGDRDKNYFLLFEGAAQASVVKVNGVQVAAHKGGYTPYVVNIGEAARKGVNRIEVTCSNKEDLAMIPVTSDFNKNGGLHNPVWLLDMDDIYFSPEEYGMYRLRCETPVVTRRNVETKVATRIVNSGDKDADILVRVQLLESDGRLGYQADRTVNVKAFSDYEFTHDFLLSGLRLWEGVDDPYMYTLRIEMFKGRRMMDIVETKIGYRTFTMDPDLGFLLNGRSYPLRGVAMHQDMDGKASALENADYNRDWKIIEELGANFLRLAHYPHNDRAFQLCDSLGIIVQTEIPWVNVCGTSARMSYFNNIQNQLKEMIVNYMNHPSIVFWGLWNELDTWGNNDLLQGALDPERVSYETAKLYDFAKKLDPDRCVGFSDDSRLQRDGYPDLKSDYCSENLYFGWYYTPNEFGGFTRAMDDVRRLRGNGVVNVSEYGVGINPFCHTWNDSLAVRDPEDESRHFEEYGNRFHESYVSQIEAMPWLNFTSAWVLFDFPVASRREGYMDSPSGLKFTRNKDRMYMNDKGLVTRDRKTRKDVFYLYKSLWNKNETTVYITSRRRTAFPAGEELAVKVYSNAKYLSLFHNDKLVAKLFAPSDPTGVVWQFPGVFLKPGDNTFRVVSNNGVSDEVTVSRIPRLN